MLYINYKIILLSRSSVLVHLELMERLKLGIGITGKFEELQTAFDSLKFHSYIFKDTGINGSGIEQNYDRQWVVDQSQTNLKKTN